MDPTNGWKVRLFVKGEEYKNPIVPIDLEKFSICEQLDKGNVTIDGKKYFCHVLKAVSDGAFIIGNNICLVKVAPGVFINVCPHPHPHVY